jgi:hypothetical protein
MVNIGRGPSRMRNKWFEFHLNGPGSTNNVTGWENHGDVATINDLTEAQGLVYKPDSSGDNGKTITVYGYDDNDKEIIGGITLTGNSTYAFANISAQKIKRISRIVRDSTTGYAQLLAYNSDGTIVTQLGYYYPDETEPNYSRIKIPSQTCWIRMRYRKRALKVSSLTDPIHLRSRRAVLAMMGAIKAMGSGKVEDLQLADALEKKALQWLGEERIARNPGGTWKLKVDTRTNFASPEHGRY